MFLIIKEIATEVIYMNDKKRFIIPEALIVNFSNDDIITESGDWWLGGGDNGEQWGPEIPDGNGDM